MSKSRNDQPGAQVQLQQLPVLQVAPITLPPMASMLSEVPPAHGVRPRYGSLPYHQQQQLQSVDQHGQMPALAPPTLSPLISTPLVSASPPPVSNVANLAPQSSEQRPSINDRQVHVKERLSHSNSPSPHLQVEPVTPLDVQLPAHTSFGPQRAEAQIPITGRHPESPEIPRTPPPASTDAICLPADSDPANTNIYTAVYSGVPVYEMISRGIAVMRRRADSFLNATQILKVAGIDKGKRTKILERQIITGEHEKVQGGYGKYQGTWIPFEKGKALAEQYGVERYLRPLFLYQPTTSGTPGENTPTKEQAVAAMRKEAYAKGIAPPSRKRPRPDSLVRVGTASAPSTPFTSSNVSPSTPKQNISAPPLPPRSAASCGAVVPVTMIRNADRHRSTLVSAFLTGREEDLPEILSSPIPPVDLDVNIAIDDQGHTALHWASALARMNILRRLVALGADACRPNYMGETPLMRAALVTNSFDRACFPELLDLLGASVATADAKGRTVLHHIAITAGVSGCAAAAKYYMDCVARWIGRRAGRFPALIDAQDRNGDTALNIAARIGSQPVVALLLSLGADRNIASKVGLCPADFGLDDLEATAMEAACEAQWTSRPSVPLTPRTSPQQDIRTRGVKSDHEVDSRRRLELAEAVRQAVLEIDTQRDSDLFQIHQLVCGMKKEICQLSTIISEISELIARFDSATGAASTTSYACPQPGNFRKGELGDRPMLWSRRPCERSHHPELSLGRGEQGDGRPLSKPSTTATSKFADPVSQLTWEVRDLTAEILAQVREADSARTQLRLIRARHTAAASAGTTGISELLRTRSSSSPPTSPAACLPGEESRLQNLRRLISAFCGVSLSRVDELAESLLSNMDMATARETMASLRAALRSAEQK